METNDESRQYLPPHTKAAVWAISFLLFYSVAMFTLPFAAFYGTKHALKEYLGIEDFRNTVWSVVASVVMVHVIIFAYAYQGYCEKEYDDDGNEIDQSICEPVVTHKLVQNVKQD